MIMTRRLHFFTNDNATSLCTVVHAQWPLQLLLGTVIEVLTFRHQRCQRLLTRVHRQGCGRQCPGDTCTNLQASRVMMMRAAAATITAKDTNCCSSNALLLLFVKMDEAVVVIQDE